MNLNESSPAVTWEVVADIWTEFVTEFHSESVVCDQIMIVSDNLLLRSPNFDLMSQVQQSCLVN
jgi:hypothetical protein